MRFTVLAVGLSLAAIDVAAENHYHFSTVAQTGGDVAFLWPGGLNNRGEVVFTVQCADGTSALSLGDGAHAATVLENSGFIGLNPYGKSLTDGGRIGFSLLEVDSQTYETTGTRLFMGRPDRFNVVAESHPNADGLFLGPPAINDGGATAFLSEQVTDGLITSAIQFGFQSRFEVVAQSAAPFEWVRGPALNGCGTVAYWRAADPGAESNGLYVHRSGVTEQVFNSTTQGLPEELDLMGLDHSFALNDAGSVAFDTFRSVCYDELFCLFAGSRVLRVDAGIVTTIAEYSGTLSPGPVMGLNNWGEVCYAVYDESTASRTIYVANGQQTNRILGTGDVLFGKSVQFLHASGPNERSQVALAIHFADGTQAVVIATPEQSW